MIIVLAVSVYVVAMVAANFLVLYFGPQITPINAFALIGLDLALRDFLHYRLRPVAMGVLILTTGLITYLLNNTAQNIAIASSAAFALSAVTDWFVFSYTKGRWITKSVASNTVGAAVDSVAFPTIAFGAFMPEIVLGQFLAKTAGGTLWSICLGRLREKNP